MHSISPNQSSKKRTLSINDVTHSCIFQTGCKFIKKNYHDNTFPKKHRIFVDY